MSAAQDILKRLGMSRLPAPQRYKRDKQGWKRYEKQRPGHQLQSDVKFIEPITTDAGRKKRYYQYIAIDDRTRLRILKIYPDPCSTKASAMSRSAP